MPLVAALRAWLVMVPTVALISDMRLAIVIQDGRLEVIETKKPQKVSQIPTSEQYQLKSSRGISLLHKNCPSWSNVLIL